MNVTSARSTPATPARQLSAGDVMPNWSILTTEGKPFSFYTDSVAGNVIVICYLPAAASDGSIAESNILCRKAELDRAGARLYLVLAADGKCPMTAGAPVRLLIDHEHQIRESLGAANGPITIVFRQNNHVAGRFDGDAESQAQGALDLAARIGAETATVVVDLHHPPVLLIPDVFSRDECRGLIDIYETRGQVHLQERAALNYLGRDYKMRVPEHMREDRVDHFFFEEPTLGFLTERINRVTPEILKAFQYRVTRYESLRMACYRGERRGYGHGHRDNVPPHLHRRFAMSINLNTEEFEGGELRFPEFGDRRYRPPAGTAIVFSSSLLHEALHVTCGRRFVFLAFLFGEY